MRRAITISQKSGRLKTMMKILLRGDATGGVARPAIEKKIMWPNGAGIISPTARAISATANLRRFGGPPAKPNV